MTRDILETDTALYQSDLGLHRNQQEVPICRTATAKLETTNVDT
jgi:hypothetical protein